jgi:SAM-dependent methyltransferase
MATTPTASLIEWKTGAWQDPAQVAWYSQRMVANQGTNRLKNRLEVDLLLAHARGETVLDVGVGTGRGALPLAAAGKQVTGVDISQAMLDECQRLAGAAGLTLATRACALDALPFADASYDSLVALNVMMHFPHWQQILAEWARVVRPGGRLLFDVHSLDHYRAALGRQVSEAELLQTEHAHYVLRLAAEDLLAEADRCGLVVVGLFPYGAFLGGGNRNHLLGGLEDKAAWARLLSWLATDEEMLAFALFLERELIAHLTPTVTGRFMAVLERRIDARANQAWLARNQQLDGWLRQTPIDVVRVARRVGSSQTAWRQKASAHLQGSLRCRRLLECLVTPLVSSGRLKWSQLVSPPLDTYFAELQARRADDRLATDLATRLPHGAAAPALRYQDVPLGAGCEYQLVERLLTAGLGRFSGVRS